jgi:hypothetical protein
MVFREICVGFVKHTPLVQFQPKGTDVQRTKAVGIQLCGIFISHRDGLVSDRTNC